MARGKKKPPGEGQSPDAAPGVVRPTQFDRAYIVALARNSCLMPEVPEEVARAFVDILCAHQVLEEDARGNMEIAGSPGATEQLPERAGVSLWQATRRAIERKRPDLDIMEYLVRGSGAAGSGATGSRSGGSSGPRVDPSPARARKTTTTEPLRELEWNKDQVIRGLGEGVSKQARVVVEWVLAKLRGTSGGAASAIPAELPERLELVLTAMLQLKANDQERRKSGDAIGRRAFGPEDGGNAKQPLADLKRLGLVGSMGGRRGGSWVTPKGIEWAKANGIKAE